ncbi:MAG: HD-GYP domain-containing protein [Lachnospiraceae bacterium]|nr:HD-GYP domain-containing protein [Lachnospiraceae bacterium]
MKRVRISDLRPGMKTAEDVFSYNNQMIVPRGSVLDDKMITRLEFYSVLAVRISDETDADDEGASEQAPSGSAERTEPYSKRVRESKEFKKFEESFLKTTETFKEKFKDIAESGGEIDSRAMVESVTSLIADDMTGGNVFDMLHNMRQYDDFTYMHSMNVALICNVFAKWLGMRAADVDILTLGGLLHDIGKLKIPDNIIRKPDKLSPAEYNIIKTHSLQGYNILKDKNIDDNVKQCALMHHERCDGSGYPLGLSADKINNYAKIVAIADVYDAMTAARIYRGPLCPFKVISIFEAEGLQKYDGHYILTFLEHVATTYMNNRVRLNNGMEGDVIFMNRNQYSRPMLQCGDKFIDLSREPDLYIETFV